MTSPRRRARWILAAIAVAVAGGGLVAYRLREPILARWWLRELIHRDWRERGEVVERLLELRRPETVDSMVQIIRAGDHGERYPLTEAAAWVLAGLGGLALDRLLELASDSLVSVRYLALEALAALAPDDPRTREALERLSHDPDKEVQREARYRLEYARPDSW